MARIMARMTPAHINAMIDAAQIQDETILSELRRVVLGRRQKVLSRYLGIVSSLTYPEVRVSGDKAELCLHDLGVTSGIFPTQTRQYGARAWLGDKLTRHEIGELSLTPEVCATLPVLAASTPEAPQYLIMDMYALHRQPEPRPGARASLPPPRGKQLPHRRAPASLRQRSPPRATRAEGGRLVALPLWPLRACHSRSHPQPHRASRVICHCAGCRAWAERIEPSLLDERGRHPESHREPGEPRARPRARAPRLHPADPRRCTPLAHHLLRRFARPDHEQPPGSRSSGSTRIACRLPPVASTTPSGRCARGVNLDDIPRAERRALQADFRSLLRMLKQLAPLTAKWWWRGDHRRLPFVDGRSLEPVVEVRQLEAPPTLRLVGCR